MDIKTTYFGFTDNKKPMQKAKIEQSLDKLIRVDGVVVTRKEFIRNILKKGYIPYIEENYCYYSKKLDDYTKPKNDYRLTDQKENSFYQITKTEHDYANYLLENNYIDDVTANNYITAEQKRLKEEQEAKLLAKQLEEEQKQREEQEEQKFKEWLDNEALEYKETDTRVSILEEIYLSEINTFGDLIIRLLVLIDNIEQPRCKEKLISWLHIGNKTSK
ncbi:MAG: hypothetical protein ACOCRK_07450, partial [bacterium]